MLRRSRRHCCSQSAARGQTATGYGCSSHEICDGADEQTVFFDIYEQADEDVPGTEPQLPLKLEANAAAADALAEKGAQTDLAMHPGTYIGIASTPLDLATHGLAAMAMMHTADICRSLKVGHELVCDVEPLPKHDYATHRELLRFDETEAIAAMRRVTACLAELTAEANRGFHETEEDIEYDFIGIWAPHPKVPVGACVSGISAAERDIAFAAGSYPPTEPGGIGLLQLAVAAAVAIKQQARAKGKGKSKGKSKGDKWAPYQPCGSLGDPSAVANFGASCSDAGHEGVIGAGVARKVRHAGRVIVSPAGLVVY